MDLSIPVFATDQELGQYFTSLADTAVKGGSSLQTGFTTSFLTILVCEVGDKTFFLAMIMATRYLSSIVFLGSYGALFVMTILSTIFGKIATAWISPLFTNVIVTILFFYFGVKMLLEARKHQDEQENEELKEVEHQLEEMQTKYIQRHSNQSAKSTTQPLIPKPQSSLQPQPSPQPTGNTKPIIPNTFVLTQAFLMTFLAEWGDRSQIATIALAASFNPYMVTFGALLGHLICTAAAIRLGYWISGKISEKRILTIGGIVFIISGLCTAALVIDNLSDSPSP